MVITFKNKYLAIFFFFKGVNYHFHTKYNIINLNKMENYSIIKQIHETKTIESFKKIHSNKSN